MRLDREELTAGVVYQIGALAGFLRAHDMELNHVKVHGSLYGMSARDPEVAAAIADAADVFGAPLVGMVGTAHEQVWGDRPAGFVAEYYADLDYRDDGSLIITREHEAFDPVRSAERALRAVTEGRPPRRTARSSPCARTRSACTPTPRTPSSSPRPCTTR